MNINVYGIRHHGPGSAKAVLAALRDNPPDILLVEGPNEAEPLLPFILDPDLKPPVAALVYNAKDLQQAHYLPFASFSPEFVAIKWALKKDIPIKLIDLPISKQLGLEEAEKKKKDLIVFGEKHGTESDEMSADPLGFLAKIAGYEDRERWWEVHFENQDHPATVFDMIMELMAHLREETARQETPETLLREAHMREGIRAAIKAGHKNLAVVCGAWHAPILRDTVSYKASHDKSLLRGLPKINCAATWIPWNYEQLSTQSGYGAGVISPEWYHLLFNNRGEADIRWMTKAGRLLRKKDFTTSSAHIIESVNLARSLAALRDLPIAGIDEMEEAAISTFCEGNSAPLKMVRQRLVIGTRVGKVPKVIPVIPFQKDMEKIIKKTRLTKYRETNEAHWLKGTMDKPRGGIDLREANDLLKSQFLHRLNLLDIPWGEYQPANENDLGGFKEYWKLHWKASFAMRIIEAGMWGNTVEDAARNFIQKKAAEAKSINDLGKLLQQALFAQVPNTVERIIGRLKEVSAQTIDIPILIKSISPLIISLRYGTAREMDTRQLSEVLLGMIPRICLGIPGAAQSLDEDASQDFQQDLFAFNQDIQLLEQEDLLLLWKEALEKLSLSSQTNALLIGFANRMLLDAGWIGFKAVSIQLHFGLSKAQSKQDAALWIEGFLFGSGQLLIYQNELWALINTWIQGLEKEDFEGILPLLRRGFSDFSESEREKMLNKIRHPELQAASENAMLEIDEDQLETVNELMNLMP